MYQTNQVYQEESSVTRSIMCMKMFQVRIKKYRGYHWVPSAWIVSIKCIKCNSKKYQVYQGVLGVSDVYKVYQIYINNEGICDILPFDVWVGLCFCHFLK